MPLKKARELVEKISKVQPRQIGETVWTMHKSFRSEFQKQATIAVTAAFGFLIALVWKDYLMSVIKVQNLNIFSVLFITSVCVVGLMLLAKWSAKTPSS